MRAYETALQLREEGKIRRLLGEVADTFEKKAE